MSKPKRDLLSIETNTQPAVVLRHLLARGSITAIEAQTMYKIRSLTRRICDLRCVGYDIKAENRCDLTGQRYVRYWLRKREPCRELAIKYWTERLNKHRNQRGVTI